MPLWIRNREGMDPSQRAKSLLDKARARAEKLNTARLRSEKTELRKKAAAEELRTESVNESVAVEESPTPLGDDEIHPSQTVEVELPTHSETISRKRVRDPEEVVEDEPARKMTSRKKKGRRNSAEPFPSVPVEEDIFGRMPDLPAFLRDLIDDEVEVIGVSEPNVDPTINYEPVRVRVNRPTRPSSSFRAGGPSFSEGSKGSLHVDPKEGILINDPKVAASTIKSVLPREVESRLDRLTWQDLAELLRLQGLSNLFLSHRAASILEEEEENRMSLLTEYIRKCRDLETEVVRLNAELKKTSEEKNFALAEKSKLDAVLKQSNEKAERHLENELKMKGKVSTLEKEIVGLKATNSELLKGKEVAETNCSFAEVKFSKAKKDSEVLSLELSSARAIAEILEKENGEFLAQLKEKNSSLMNSLSEIEKKMKELEKVCAEASEVTESALEEARDEGREESFPVLKEFVLKFPNADFTNLTYIEALETRLDL
ncbi:hypothetical protein J5N97_002577 [Dioscorea zingiberensis]|uniref:Uncharacterized protein n=1 Tax=Dioscorea zingiberensis TaxID=325984 RepID=A0A9D5D301_9LILI|nr:hypothetical protein J5N97_002577 [Dioscorea zingiberensis]